MALKTKTPPFTKSLSDQGRERSSIAAFFFHPLLHLKPYFFTPEALQNAFQWISHLRKKYSPNADIWNLRRLWHHIKDKLLTSLNNGSYQFSPLDRYEFQDTTLSLWSSQDMIALKLITAALEEEMGEHIPESYYHIRGRGGLKKAATMAYKALPKYQYVMRSDIKSYYDSIDFSVLMKIIESYTTRPILLTLIGKACRRTETRGGIFYDYYEKGLPMGSPLSPLLGAIALIPLDKAMGEMKNVFYARFMDDWVVLTKSKRALRKVVKITHKVVGELKLQLHPTKTYIGKISHGFNFLAYYIDDQKILPSKESIQRFLSRGSVLYEPRQENRKTSRRNRRHLNGREISEYQVNEEAPTDGHFKNILTYLLTSGSHKPDHLVALRKYVGQWTRWLKSGLSSLSEFETSVSAHLPCLFSCWRPGSGGSHFGRCHESLF
jgi:hypothetical protein